MAKRRWLACPVNETRNREGGGSSWLNVGWSVEYQDWPNPTTHQVLMYLNRQAADAEGQAKAVAADYNAKEEAK